LGDSFRSDSISFQFIKIKLAQLQIICSMNLTILFSVFLGFCLIAILPQIILCLYSKSKGINVVFIFLLLFCLFYEYILIKLDRAKSQEDIFYLSRCLSLAPSILITLQAIFVALYTNIFYKRLFWIIIISIVNFIVYLLFQIDLVLHISTQQHFLSTLHAFFLENKFRISTISNFSSFFVFILTYVLLILNYRNYRKKETLISLVILGSQAFLIVSTFYTGTVRIHTLLLEFCNVILIMSVSALTSIQIFNNETLYASIYQQKKMRLFKDDITHFILTDFKEPLDTLSNITSIDSKEKITTTVKSTAFRMLNVVVNMLDVYKYNQHEIILNKSICNLEYVLNRSVIRFNTVFEKKNISININYSINGNITIDENLIERVLVNILDTFTESVDKNAIIDISVSEMNNEELFIRISCFGVRFSRVRMSHFTNILQNSDTNAYDNYSDVLSLSFCKMVIEAHEGEIRFEFDKKSNHAFCITLLNGNKNELSANNTLQGKLSDVTAKIVIANDEKKSMSKYYQLLQDTQLFEITKLKLMIAELEKDKRINSCWISELKVSVREMDDNKYLYLREMIKPNK